jgi:deoxycytidine triphosphate deaminase
MPVLSGKEVAKILGINDEEQIQPNGVDLRLGRVLTFPSKTINFSNVNEDNTRELEPLNNEYHLKFGAYLIEFQEVITIPLDCVGFVFPRSTLLRHGLDLRTAVWDSGYEGKGKCLLVNYREHAIVKKGFRIGQIVMIRAENVEKPYSGRYQKEGIS